MLEFLPKQVRGVAEGILKLGLLLAMALYVLSPLDLLPEALLGPVGYIDDILVAVVGFSMLAKWGGFDLMKSAKEQRQIYRAEKKEK